MKQQFQLFCIALMFYTRIPIPFDTKYSDDKLNASTRFFPLIGYIVGGLSFCTYYILQFFLPLEISIIGAFIAGILITGAFHEDGLADFFDGFGGGWTKEKILDIMKDSRVGTYGMVATIIQLALKFYCLYLLIPLVEKCGILWIFMLFVTYHSIARFSAIQLCFLMNYVRDDEKSKAKPIAKKHSLKEIIGVYIFGLFPLICFSFLSPLLLVSLIPLTFIIFYFKKYLSKWIGGYTGDCLGALEQICEGIFLVTVLGLWKFIS
ncbi:adenosylcobinamide-GDP ribazoletransferase [Faecalibacter rhinopitheci]|uniref:Adenosylcobinamide-GDP ribazoletransferase n=1 Tax=Faecalibacter rhinopitheci TaxID=2779678 RepID=A0A8J7KHI6_9FLAO|nr:adenosylcobinamide-GDP ribazoletransferase [Faecalibacter rhinopitheci]MBF0596376.1 adenosylcobinamide-GDP ribazoletransferase [Faecalibacter rhinopitheci]